MMFNLKRFAIFVLLSLSHPPTFKQIRGLKLSVDYTLGIAEAWNLFAYQGIALHPKSQWCIIKYW